MSRHQQKNGKVLVTVGAVVAVLALVAFLIWQAIPDNRKNPSAKPLKLGKQKTDEIKNQFDRQNATPEYGQLKEEIASADLSILFIGNSHTSNPKIAEITEWMLRKKNPDMKLCLVSQTYGGTALTIHAKTKKTLDLIAAGPWDYIVLQGPRHPSTTKGAREIASLESISDETQILLYSVWGTQNSPSAADPIYEQMKKVGASIDAGIVPVGKAWLQCHRTDREVPLYASDGNHSTIVGGYLTCCVFFSYLTKQSCKDMGELEFSEEQLKLLTPDVRSQLEKIAWNTHQKFSVFPKDDSSKTVTED